MRMPPRIPNIRIATAMGTTMSLSHEILRIDVDHDPHAAALGRRGREHRTKKTLKIGIARRAREQPETMPAANDRNGCLGGTEQRNLVFARQAAQCAKPPFGIGRKRVGGADQSARM